MPSTFPTPVLIEDLPPYEAPKWLWQGFLAPHTFTMFSGLWKSGKTTLLSHLIRAISTGSGAAIGTPTQKGKILVVSEEHTIHWRRRHEDMGFGEGAVSLISQPVLSRFTPDEWVNFIKHLADLITEHEYDLVILDTIAGFWPVEDENNASQMGAALAPLTMITKHTEAALLAVHHVGKNDRGEGKSSRGSGAFMAGVDVIIEFRRTFPECPGPNRFFRSIKTLSRFPDTPENLVLLYQEDGSGYLCCENPEGQTGDLKYTPIRDAMQMEPPGETSGELADRLGLSLNHTRKLLSKGTAAGMWSRSGNGTAKDPYRYFYSENGNHTPQPIPE